jgi:hypothetical protein
VHFRFFFLFQRVNLPAIRLAFLISWNLPAKVTLMRHTKPALASSSPLELRRDTTGKIFSHIRQKWLIETPEERVRQEYVCSLVNEYD